ncbi:MAG: phosphatase PAP2 family protein [Rhodanobacter sp.]
MLGIIPIVNALKGLVQRVRPWHDHGLIIEHSWRFRSGHAFGATVFYGMLRYVRGRVLPQRFHRMVIAANVPLNGTIGISRIVLQVNYFTDVVAGYASGTAWLLLCMGVAEHQHVFSRRSTNNAPRVLEGIENE